MYASCINIVTCAVYAVLVYYVCMYCMYVAMYVRSYVCTWDMLTDAAHAFLTVGYSGASGGGRVAEFQSS